MKLTNVEKVIAQLESEKAAIQLAIDKLKAQLAAKPPRVRKLKVVEAKTS